ncbi:hypothetical protein CKM354_001277100 [Cercospora kikuchii]|uniref:Uncharacterized protein n=1 Tax=Cercospora kikuchii TaxID=84275 RepID=A0A9P3FMR8_9PEZI|nr:uncharacterized protein CKM354_001277100 [Cercospora kikuchii]GIZ49744.1 hypothetical protein CKM354_001277100 [Cercospora kikuchii]
MSKFLTGPNIIAGAGLTGAIVYFATRENMFETHGTQNIANAYSRAGGSKTHAPGIATKLGEQSDAEDTRSRQENPKGVDTEYFKENHASQKSDAHKGGGAPFGKKLNEAAYGHEGGK